MSMVFDDEKKIIRIDVPNSEANIDAQHFGIKDRSVGSYYMSECYDKCFNFLNKFEGDFYIDLTLSIKNSKEILNELYLKNYKSAFKSNLSIQYNTIEALEWFIKADGYFHKMKPPSVNDNEKYLKLDNEDAVVSYFKNLVLGDLVSIYIQKIGNNGFLFYLDKNPNFEKIMKNNIILKWMR